MVEYSTTCVEYEYFLIFLVLTIENVHWNKAIIIMCLILQKMLTKNNDGKGFFVGNKVTVQLLTLPSSNNTTVK